MPNQPRTISIVIPVFNEQSYILTTIKRVLSAKTNKLKKELIIVDDGSTDQTWQQLLKLPELHPRENIILIRRSKNSGKGAALKAGFLQSTGDIVLVQDADLEYHPDDYPQLLEPFIKYQADVVYGSRFITHLPHRVLYFWHYQANLLLTQFSNLLTNLNLSDMETGYKLFNGPLLRKIAPKLTSPRFGFEPEITARISKIPNLKLYEVGISYAGRTYLEGKKINWVDGVKSLWQIIYFNLIAK